MICYQLRLKVLAVGVWTLCMGGLSRAGAVEAYRCDTVAGDPMHVRMYTLENGLKVYLSVNKDEPRIQANVAVRTGSRNDPAETTGLAHYLEHLMFKGTSLFGTADAAAERPYLDEIRERYEAYRKLTDGEARRRAYHEIDSVSQIAAQWNIPNEYDKLMAAIGSDGSNAFTSFDITCYVENIPANEVDKWARIQADRFEHMVIRGFHTELEAVYEEYNIGLASDDEKSFDALMKKLFPTHPYGTQTTIGTQEHLKNPSIVNIENYYHRYYRPDNVAIVMAGDLNPEETIAIIDKYFGGWKGSGSGGGRGCDTVATYGTDERRGEEGKRRGEEGKRSGEEGERRAEKGERSGEEGERRGVEALPALDAPADTTVVGLEAENVLMGWRTREATSLQGDTLELIRGLLNNGTAGLVDLNINQKMTMQGAQVMYEPLAEHGIFIMAGVPKEGQTLEEVRNLLLEQVDLLKEGAFTDELLTAVRNNMKLSEQRALEQNGPRARRMQNAFVNGKAWRDVVEHMARLERISKDDIVAFANKFFSDGRVTVFKRQGEDSSQKPIEKPEITPIPTNRHLVSRFVEEIQQGEVVPIAPRFVDFDRDMARTKTRRGLPLIYKHNAENDLFTLTLYFPFGACADKRLSDAAEYIDLLGTKKMSAQALKNGFYQLACRMSIDVDDYETRITLSGLNDNLGQALALLEQVLDDAVADKEVYDTYVALTEKAYADAKQEQRQCFSRLRAYGVYGPRNSQRNILSVEELRQTEPEVLTGLISKLRTYRHEVLYYGPTPLKELDGLLTRLHHTPRRLQEPPAAEDYAEQSVTKPEVLLAPYEAKNIYMMMYANEDEQWDPAQTPVATLFNEYYGGGMNGIVFQEMRESRGLAYSASANVKEIPYRKGHPIDNYTYIITQTDKMSDCISTFNQILDSIPESEAAFVIAKQALTKRLATQRQTRSRVLSAWLAAQQQGIDYDINRRIYEALPGLTMQDVLEFGRKTMSNKTRRYLILGDEKALDMERLNEYAPVRRLSLEEIFGY